MDLRKRLGLDTINAINERIVQLKTGMEFVKKESDKDDSRIDPDEDSLSVAQRTKAGSFLMLLLVHRILLIQRI
ncbi:hypothetical protein GCM10028895_55630 [Pontibacter rugosus]